MARSADPLQAKPSKLLQRSYVIGTRARRTCGIRRLIALFTPALGMRLPEYLPDFLGVKGKEGQWENREGSVEKSGRVSGERKEGLWGNEKKPAGNKEKQQE